MGDGLRAATRHATVVAPSAQIRPGKTKRKAFTLVELLVVVAILALLLAILSPSFQRAKDVARTAICGSNLHSQGVALQLYVTRTGYYPGLCTWHEKPYYITWAPRIRTFAGGDSKMFWCPTADADAKWVPRPGSGLPAAYGYAHDEQRMIWSDRFCYGYNNWGQGPDWNQPQYGLGGISEWVNHGHREDWGEISATRIRVPSDMIAIGDSRAEGVWDHAIDPQPNEVREWPGSPHLETTNILFCDGHVTRMAMIDLIDDTPAAKRQWNNDHRPH